MRRSSLLLASSLLLSLPVFAAKPVNLSPQGEVAEVRQIVSRFDESMVRMGNAQAANPFSVECSDSKAAQGQGRWVDDKNWVFDFARDLPPGMKCSIKPVAGLKSLAGNEWQGSKEYRFNTGGPFVRQSRPYEGETIEDDQVFVLQLNGPATSQSLQANMWCQAKGLGERIPVKLLEGAERKSLIDHFHLSKEAERIAMVSCQQKLPAGTTMQLVFGKGVASPNGITNKVEKRLDFTVREPFKASFSCERENASAPCTPLMPLNITFSSPISRKMAESIVLRGPGGEIKAKIGRNNEDHDQSISSIQFPAPLPEKADLTIELPKDFQDEDGHRLVNAERFPLKTKTASMPPLAKFSAAPFGVVERFAEKDTPPLLPVTLRNVEADLKIHGVYVSHANSLHLTKDADIIRWFKMVQRLHENSYNKKSLDRILAGEEKIRVDGKPNEAQIETRTVSLLKREKNTKELNIPKPDKNDTRPFEVVGIPLNEPGFHIVEIESPLLGKALLDRNAPMFVRTSALVTNLGVHFKQGRENSLVWVTSLDKGKPVANAEVHIANCKGVQLATATTDSDGIARIDKALPQASSSDCDGMEGLFISARAKDAQGIEDMAFTLSSWNRGIESWRFDLPTDFSTKPTVRTHTVLDRTLFRAGETVSMKHFIRAESRKGFVLPAKYPENMTITHLGTGTEYELPVHWRTTATGGKSAETSFKIPADAKLGVYEVQLHLKNDEGSISSTSFRVEEFRLPVLEGKVGLSGGSKAAPLVNTTEAPLDVQVNYISGGGANNLPVRVSALVRSKFIDLSDYSSFSFSPPSNKKDQQASESSVFGDDDEPSEYTSDQKLVADKLPLTLDKNGTGKIKLTNLPKVTTPKELLLEASFSDPNGEIQTIRSLTTLWPAAVITGIKSDSWVSVDNKLKIQAIALGLDGKPLANTDLEVKAQIDLTTTTRKRMVGGFYNYDSKTETKELGKLCSGKSDARGLLLCDVSMKEAGNVVLVVTAKDKAGNSTSATTSIWVTKHGEIWFGGENHDRMDVLPEKTSYAPGETAKFQVRMPFRKATALVSIEREGIMETQVLEISGDDPTIELKVKPDWGPNVYVSVLALRGRVHDVPWYSFFTWGWKHPVDWWKSWRSDGQEYTAPTSMVDLAKPAFKLGVAEIKVNSPEYTLNVEVKADKQQYPIRSRSKVHIKVKLPDGKPAANGEVALAAVDEALLELMPNTSWDVLESLLQRRSWGVETSTAQMEIIGRRHFGKKAVPAGGGGGKSPTRELFDTLLLWKPDLKLDANGEADIEVPLNDSITSFRIVAIADHGVSRFGKGETTIRANQDLQIISGLPPLVREGDEFRAQLTLRNSTNHAMKVLAKASGPMELPPQTIDIPAGEAREASWSVLVPARLGLAVAGELEWTIDAKEQGGAGVADKMKVKQKLLPAVPVTVQQATLIRLDGPLKYPVQQQANSLPDRGGLRLSLQPTLVEGLPAIHDWFIRYPFACLEQKTSKAVGLRDAKLWQSVAGQLPNYLDSDGLASYFPPRDGELKNGSDILTSYLLSSTDEARRLGLDFQLPAKSREMMETALINFVEGRIKRDHWAPVKDLDARKLAALEALSRSNKVEPRMLGSITLAPNQWPTSAVIDWYAVLIRTSSIPQREARLKEAEQILRSRLSFQGTRMGFSTEKDDYWWWLMVNGDVNSAKLLSVVMDLPQWKDDLPRLVTGMIGRQSNGAWATTTANLWGGLALERFSQKFESTPVAGTTRAELEVSRNNASVDWSRVAKISPAEGIGPAVIGSHPTLKNNSMNLPWPAKGAPDNLLVNHTGSGKPWLTVQSLAAVILKQPVSSGYQISKTITPVEQAVKGRYTRGDVLRITLDVEAQTDMSWVVLNDPIPAGSTLLGNGLGRDSEIATQGEKRGGWAWPSFEERSFESYRAYYEYAPKGHFKLEYTVRLNNAGEFNLPPTRVEAMYAPEMFGMSPNAKMKVIAK